MSSVFDRLSEDKKRVLSELRAQIMQLDSEIIEQVRPHRIVYSKNFFMMDFAEITLKGNAIQVTPISREANKTETVLVNDPESIQRAIDVVRAALKRLTD
ncbi:hypothetical protein B9Q06_06635 [Candidatus Marsarchaeota G2 archaeon ECH_B_2]|uniref:DUF5655 domain-containing protein n=2 Tax=Candidatus Marsarchaeota group 2 TaxID=2203771 RepID=A0A2R6B8Y8_9ARCH|nr:MAG: hypothetical protein B9Q06_06635 [Candidatus Marsarchaeota G2 archaeon ECH_B_2]PSO01986.1 MAG: hypothetical protein B9Q05_06895 [Candidatus Marsarchaeota G2 archaeon ECH_B_1]